jgi:hypothetical protein
VQVFPSLLLVALWISITIAAIITGRTVSVKTFLKEKFLEACAKRLIFYTKGMTT